LRRRGAEKDFQMRSRLLTTTAVLLASIATASAQTPQQGGAAQSQAPAQQGAQGKETPVQSGQEKGRPQQGAQGKETPVQSGQEKGRPQQGAQGKETPVQSGQEKGRPQQGVQGHGQTQPSGSQAGQAETGGGQATGSATLTTEQRTTIRETVITKGPRVNSVNFSVNVGTVIPRTVTVVEVPTVLVEVYPQYRGRKYFVYNDEIIIVDDDFRILAIVTV
jgi:hypothetical protein